jgi:hypothetical protein
MITLTHKNKIKKLFKKVFPKGYAKEVQAKLNAKGIVTKKGKEYGVSYIGHVLNGLNTNLDIEETIIALYEEKKNELLVISNRRKEIFSTKKPEAGTSGLI